LGKIYVVGLGNPGPQYELSRHNLGFLTVDFFVDKYLRSVWKEKFRGFYTEGVLSDKTILVLKPMTYMNNSGEAVKKIVKYENDLSNLIVVHDDLDMEFGRIKLKLDGSDGGHRGIKSIIQHLGRKDFWRLKMGIGRGGSDPVDYVLSRFSPEQMSVLEEFLELGADAIHSFIIFGSEKTMNQFNGKSVLLNS
jgi:PTH1 family peptidyl-tRNA hydrolase